MKKIKFLFNYLVFFIIAYVIFNTAYSFVKVSVLNIIGGQEDFIRNWISGFKEVFLIYIIIYLIFIISDIVYKKIVIQKLNNELKNINERGEKR